MQPETPSDRCAIREDGTVRNVAELLPGDEIEATDYRVRYRGVVEDLAPALSVVWIRESSSGARRMLDTVEYAIRFADSSDASQGQVPRSREG